MSVLLFCSSANAEPKPAWRVYADSLCGDTPLVDPLTATGTIAPRRINAVILKLMVQYFTFLKIDWENKSSTAQHVVKLKLH